MADTIQIAKECGYLDLPTVRLAYQGFKIEEFRKQVEGKYPFGHENPKITRLVRPESGEKAR